MTWHPETPYNDLPLLPPDVVLETNAVLRAVISARASLAALDQAALLLPNPSVLLNAASILEAQASSEIENIVTTTDELFRYADSEQVPSRETKEALRYRAALYEGVRWISQRPLTVQTAAQVCSLIKDREMDLRKLPGTRIANPSTGAIIYSPPEGAPVIQDKLTDWERYLHVDDGVDPVIRMAVAHYQFEAIHPFSDGNGRTGRIVNLLLLIEAGLLSTPILYLSRYIIRHKNDYYRLLRAVTEERAWEQWVLYMVRAVDDTAQSTLRRIHAIRELQADFRDEARAASIGGRNTDLLTVLFEQPYCRIRSVVDGCDVSRQTAAGWLNDLVAAGLLRDVKVGRERVFVNWRFLEVLRETP